jgi:hypothetical protein
MQLGRDHIFPRLVERAARIHDELVEVMTQMKTVNEEFGGGLIENQFFNQTKLIGSQKWKRLNYPQSNSVPTLWDYHKSLPLVKAAVKQMFKDFTERFGDIPKKPNTDWR